MPVIKRRTTTSKEINIISKHKAQRARRNIKRRERNS